MVRFYLILHVLSLFLICQTNAETDLDTLENLEGIYTECVNDGEIALTFDDGPGSRTEAVLDVLKSYGVKATFFVNGNNSENINDPTTQGKIRRIINEGHQIGSHCWTHSNLTDNLSAETIRGLLNDLDDKFYEFFGFRSRIMRPPYGEINDTVRDILHDELGYSIIMWNIDTKDWRNQENVDESMEAYFEAMEGASNLNSSFIALHHDPVEGGTILATRAINYVRGKGYSPVLITRCIGEYQK